MLLQSIIFGSRKHWFEILMIIAWISIYYGYTLEVNRINAEIEELGCDIFLDCPDGYKADCVRIFKPTDLNSNNDSYIIDNYAEGFNSSFH